MSLDLSNSEKLNDVSNLTVRVGVKNYAPANDYIIEAGRLPMGEDIRDDNPYGFDGEGQSNITADERTACGKRPLITNSVKGKAWGRCITDFHADNGVASPAEIKTHCGKRPFFIGKRRNEYNKCKADLLTANKAKAAAVKAAKQAQIDASEQAQAKARALQMAADAAAATANQSKLDAEALANQKANIPDTTSTPASNNNTNNYPSQGISKKSNTLLYAGIGLGVLALIGAIVIVKRLRTNNG